MTAEELLDKLHGIAIESAELSSMIGNPARLVLKGLQSSHANCPRAVRVILLSEAMGKFSILHVEPDTPIVVQSLGSVIPNIIQRFTVTVEVNPC